MPEPYAVLCTCGYTTLVPGSAFGTSVECANCGAELEVDESSAAPDRSADDPAPVEGEYDRGLPESPLIVHSPFEAAPKEGPASPCEDETERSEIRPHEADRTSPSPPARSPFEEEDEETEEGPSSGPFTLEPAPESGDESFAKRIEAERPKEGNRHVIIETESSLDKRTGEKCAECGREIRGDWDRFETAEDVICYVCSNQATHGLPERLKTAPDRRELSEQDLIIHQEQPVQKPEPPWYLNPHSETFRRVLLALALGTVLLAVFVSLFDTGTPSEEVLRAAREARETAPEIVLPLWANLVIWSWRAFGVYLGFLLTLYFMLDRADRLPRDTFKTNILFICGVLSIVAGIQILTSVAYLFLMPVFVVGGFLYVLVWVLSVFVQIMVVNGSLDMRLRDWAWAIIFYFPLSQIILQSIGLFIYAGIYKLVT